MFLYRFDKLVDHIPNSTSDGKMFGLIEIDTADWTAHIVYIIHILEKNSINLREQRNE